MVNDGGAPGWRAQQKRAAVFAATTRAARWLHPEAPVRSALVMTAGHWKDVGIGMETGLYGPETRLVAVSRIPHALLDIVTASRWVGMRHRPDFREADLFEVTDLPPGLEVAVLDLCAFIDVQTALWMRDHLVPALAPGAVIILLAQTYGRARNNPMSKSARRFFCVRRKDILADFQDRLFRTVQEISEECALCLATAFAALAPAGLPDDPFLLRPYRFGHDTFTPLIIATTGDPSEFPSLEDVLGGVVAKEPNSGT